MKIQKLTALALALALLFALAACGAPAAEAPAATDAPVEATEAPAEPTEAPVAAAEEAAEAVTVRLAALTGPTAMGMAKIFSDADAGTAANSYEYALYGAADAPRSRYARLCEEYLRTFGDAPDALLISAPGRTELAGNHTDHQLGIVLCAAVTLDAAAAAASAADNAVEIVSDGFGRVRVSLDDLAPRESEAGTTAALIRGVAAGFAAEGLRIGRSSPPEAGFRPRRRLRYSPARSSPRCITEGAWTRSRSRASVRAPSETISASRAD